MINDVTASKQHTDYLEHEINHDPLTGLANRNLLWDRLEQALNFAQRSKTLVAVVLIDLDKFKFINDTYGHEAGDEVLMVIAKRMVSSMRDIDTVTRLSGDEFVLVLVNQPSLRFTLRMIERLKKGISESIMFDSTEIPLSASIGISVFPHDGNKATELMKAADVAMYHGKSGASDSVQFFSQDMKTTTDAKLQLEKDMRSALRNNEMFLQFQPCISVQTGLILGVEALVRWHHPAHGILLPSSFLPDAEENGMIIPIGNWIIEHACRFIQKIKKIVKIR